MGKIEKKESKSKRPFRDRLSVDIPTVLMNEVKKYAAKRNISITRYIIKIIVSALNIERLRE